MNKCLFVVIQADSLYATTNSALKKRQELMTKAASCVTVT